MFWSTGASASPVPQKVFKDVHRPILPHKIVLFIVSASENGWVVAER
jgi:hypothetical protein